MPNYQSIHTGNNIDNAVSTYLDRNSAALIYLTKVDANNLYPTKAGGGATGTWTISINGNSHTTDLLNNYGGRITNPSAMIADGKMRLYLSTSSMTTDKPPCGDGHILHFAWDNNSGWDNQLAIGNGGTGIMCFRGGAGNGSGSTQSWTAWKTVIDNTSNQTINGTKTFSSQPILNSGFEWPAPANVTCIASANSQEWSIDCGTSGYTGCCFHIWSTTQGASIAQFFVDNRHVIIPVHLAVGGYNNTSFGISTNSLISNGGIQCNASISAPSGSLWVGTNKNTAAERQVGTQSGAGRLYMYSQAAATGGRGLYGSNNAGNSAGYLSINQSNAATHSTTSDKRIKNDKGMLSIEETRNILTELKIVNFNYKLDEENEIKQNVEHCGVYAQDVRDLLLKYNYKNRNLLSMTIKNSQLQDEDQLYQDEEKLIPITPDISSDITIPEEEVDLYQMNYTALISYLVKGWQIHEQQIQELKQEIKEIKNHS